MKFFSKTEKILCLGALLLSALTACQFVYDDLRSCPQGVALRFTSTTPCGDELSPAEASHLRVQVYDEKGSLVTEFDHNQVTLTEKYTLFVPFSTPGRFHFTVWGTQDPAAYAFGKEANASLRLRRERMPVNRQLPRLFFGHIANHEVIDRSATGTKIDTLTVNMQPYSYDIHLSVAGNMLDPRHPYAVKLTDNNAAYDHAGNIIDTPVEYTRPLQHQTDAFEAHFNTLKLQRRGEARLHILNNEEKVLFSAPLAKLIDEIERANGTTLNLDCVHTLHIKLTIDKEHPADPYMRVSITINGWNAVWRKVILEA